MWLNEDAPIHKRDLIFSKPMVNTAGSLGLVPDPHSMPFLDQMGAFITHPISRYPHQPAGNRACIPFPGGFLLHTGLPNPGISRAISQFKNHWANAPLPVIVHLLVENPETLAQMVHKLEGLENILAIELGLPPQGDPNSLPDFLKAAFGELPVILSMNPDQIPTYLESLNDLRPAAVHLTSPRGILPNRMGENITGRLYGPAIFPQILLAAQILIQTGLTIIVDGGINQAWQAQTLLDVGAAAVGIGAALWGASWDSIFHEDGQPG